MKRLLSFAALLLVLTVLLTSCSGGLLGLLQSLLDPYRPDAQYHREVDYTTLTYTRPDTEEALARCEELTEQLRSGKINRMTLQSGFLALEKSLTALYDAQTLLEIQHSANLTDTSITEESEWLSGEFAKVRAAVAKLYLASLDSSYKDMIFGTLSEEEEKKMRAQYGGMDEEYVALMQREQQLLNAYDALNALTVEIDGEALDLAGIHALPEERVAAAMAQYYQEYNRQAGEIYLQLIPLYRSLAEKFGYASVADYCYDIVFTRSYTYADAAALRNFARENAAALLGEARQSLTAAEAGLLAGLGGENPLAGAQQVMQDYFAEVSPYMAEAYAYMQKYHLYDIASGAERTQGAFTTTFLGKGMPFLFATLSGDVEDVLTVTHEFGHFYAFYHHGNGTEMDICEIQSQGNEWLLLPRLSALYGEEATGALEKYQWMRAWDTVLQGCIMDEFQQMTFSGEYTTVEELNEAFAALAEAYGLDGSLYSVPLEYLWSVIPHNFHYPFYYISYAASIIPALELFILSQSDRPAALQAYLDVLTFGDGRYDFAALMERVGLGSPFQREALSQLADGFRVFLASGGKESERN